MAGVSANLLLAAGAIALFWGGAVFAISFLEAPLKFRAPGVTIPLGLGIGRVVFRALNLLEVVLAAAVLVTVVAAAAAGSLPTGSIVLLLALVVLIVQFGFIRPRLNRHSDAVLVGGQTRTRSKIHWVYVGFEAVKLALVLTGAITVLAALR